MIKGILNLIPVAFYILIESVFISLIISTIWILLFRNQFNISLNYFQILGVVWSIKMILNNMLAISINSLNMTEALKDKKDGE